MSTPAQDTEASDGGDLQAQAPTTSPTPTRTHLTDDLSFALPLELKDKTMHVFALSDDGPSEFSLVTSRAQVGVDDTLDDFATRLGEELERALPRFRLEHRRDLQVDGMPALELFYGWSNNGMAMQQRQVVLFVEHPERGKPEAVLIAGTCKGAFSEHWQTVLDGVLQSISLRRPWPLAPMPTPNDEPEQPTQAGGFDGDSLAFALRTDGSLHALPGVEDIIACAAPREVAAGSWKFYDGAGRPLEVRWAASPRRGLLRREPGPYTLVPANPASGLGPLSFRLALVERVHGRMQSAQEVQEYLARRASHA